MNPKDKGIQVRFIADNEYVSPKELADALRMVADTIRIVKDSATSVTKEESNRLENRLNNLSEQIKRMVENSEKRGLKDIESLAKKITKIQSDIQKDFQDKFDEIVLPDVTPFLSRSEYTTDRKAILDEAKTFFKDVELDTPEILRDKLETLKDDDRLDKTAIKGLDDYDAALASLSQSISSIPRGGGGSGGIEVFKSGTKVGSGSAINFTGSGVSTVTNSDGRMTTVTISGGGGSGGSTFIDQTPDNGTYGALAGLVNSSNTVFTVSQGAYLSGYLQVYRNGLLQLQGASDDWQETTPSSGTFTFNIAPTTGDIITAVYQTSLSTTGQFQAGTNVTITGIGTALDPYIINSSGGGGGSPGGSTTQLQYNDAGAFAGITGATTDGTSVTLTSPKITTSIIPTTDDGASLGTTSNKFSDLFLASGSVVNFNSGDVTITHAANKLSFAGGTSYEFDAPLIPTAGSNLGSSANPWNNVSLANTAEISWNGGTAKIAHTSAAVLAVSVGDFRVTSPGSNSTSVVTQGAAQTLTNKTITSPTLDGTPTVSTLRAIGSGGVEVQNSSGTNVIIAGAGGGTGISLQGTTNIGSASADYVQIAGSTGASTLTATGSSTNIDITLAPKGTGSVLGNRFVTTGTAGAGYVEFTEQSSKPSTPTNATRLYVDSSNRFSWIGENGFVRTFDGTANTADRVYTLPNLEGTVALGGSHTLTSDANTTSVTAVDTNLSFAAAANTTYILTITGTASKATTTTGLKLEIGCPTATTIKGQQQQGAAAGSTAMTNSFITAINTLGSTFATGTGVEVPFRIEATVTTSSTPGNILLRFATVTSNTATIYAGTRMSWQVAIPV